MQITPVATIPTSIPGQILRERRIDGITHREVIVGCKNPRALAAAGTSIWSARHGGWVRTH